MVKITDMAKVKITQIRSAIGYDKRQKNTLIALGIKKMNQTVEHEATPQILGMAKKVSHLVKIEDVK
jgi:large subunit ribosomal protein L30